MLQKVKVCAVPFEILLIIAHSFFSMLLVGYLSFFISSSTFIWYTWNNKMLYMHYQSWSWFVYLIIDVTSSKATYKKVLLLLNIRIVHWIEMIIKCPNKNNKNVCCQDMTSVWQFEYRLLGSKYDFPCNILL